MSLSSGLGKRTVAMRQFDVNSADLNQSSASQFSSETNSSTTTKQSEQSDAQRQRAQELEEMRISVTAEFAIPPKRHAVGIDQVARASTPTPPIGEYRALYGPSSHTHASERTTNNSTSFPPPRATSSHPPRRQPASASTPTWELGSFTPALNLSRTFESEGKTPGSGRKTIGSTLSRLGKGRGRPRRTPQLDREGSTPWMRSGKGESNAEPVSLHGSPTGEGEAKSATVHQSGSATHSSPENGPTGSRYTVAIAEFRNRQTVGIAAIDMHSPSLYLAQYADNSMYSTTLTILNGWDPVEVLLSDTAEGSALHNVIRSEFQLLPIQLVKRRYFSESAGLAYLQRVGIRSALLAAGVDASQYLSLAASACLLRYLEVVQQIVWAPNSLHISPLNLARTVQIDVRTVAALELVTNVNNPLGGSKAVSFAAVSYPGRGAVKNKKLTLYDCLNHTKTRGGARLLRASILQPIKDAATLQLRHASVGELLRDEPFFLGIVAQLPLFSQLESLCASLAQEPALRSLSVAQAQITHAVALRTILLGRHELVRLCSSASTPLFQTIAQTLSGSADDIEALTQSVHAVIDSDASGMMAAGGGLAGMVGAGGTIGSSSAEQSRAQLAYVIKRGVCPLLDVARQTFAEVLSELAREAEQVINQYGLSQARLTYTTARGYHLVMPASELPPTTLTDVIVSRVYRGNRVAATTRQISSLDARQQEAFSDVCLFTCRALTDLRTTMRTHISWLHALSEAIALLDMLCSFATHISVNRGYVAPHLTTDGPIAVKQGRHPVLSAFSPSTFVSNDCIITEQHNLVIVTGPNSSGKSTYLRQIAVLSVLAHTGCYVPADYATFRVLERITTCIPGIYQTATCNWEGIGAPSSRTLNDTYPLLESGREARRDAGQRSTSAFHLEMVAMASIIASTGPNCLVLLDEPGRATSTVDGVSLTWAICEELQRRKCFTVVATHFFELVDLATVYPQTVKTVNLQVETPPPLPLVNASSSSSSSSSGYLTVPSLRYTFRVADGTTSERNRPYGIEVAEAVHFPASVLIAAKSFSAQLRHRAEQAYHRQSQFDDIEETTSETKEQDRVRKMLLSTDAKKTLRTLLQGLRSLDPSMPGPIMLKQLKEVAKSAFKDQHPLMRPTYEP